MKSSGLRLTLVQNNPLVGDIKGNAEKIADIATAHSGQTDLILFPELAICGYQPEDLILKASFINSIHVEIESLARQSAKWDCACIIPTPWRVDDKIYNAFVLIANGQIKAIRTKHHLPNYGVFDEQRVFTAGEFSEPLDFMGHKLGVLICEDMWYDDVAAYQKKQGAEILIALNASPYEAGKIIRRHELVKTRIAETGLPFIYLNQYGGQDETVFDGGSFVMNESGQIVYQAAQFTEEIQTLNFEKTAGGTWLCAANHIAPLMNETAEIYQALVTGLRDYVIKSGFSSVLIGLSGGIDSALAATIAVDALGSSAVHCVMMPSRYTSGASFEDAERVADALHSRYEIIPIENTVKALEEALAPHAHEGTPPVTFENMQSRTRGLILMTLSNAGGHMVITTGNKSEMATGYATLYGDMCGGFNPLKDLYKTKVYELSEWRNKNRPQHGLGPHGQVIPDNILTKAPTAELRENQKDQDSLPPYAILDDILECLIEKDLGETDIEAKGYDIQLVRRVSQMLKRAEYKRRQAPPGVKITTRAFGRERRYPIVNGYS